MLEALDILLIQQLLARYGHALDTADWDGLREQFVEEASIDYRSSSGRVELTGRDAIVDWFRSAGHPSAHHVTNIVVDDPDPTGHVAVHSKYFAPYTRERNVPKRMHGGEYHDVVVKTANGWRFASKQCLPGWNLTVVVDDEAPESRRTY